MPLRCQPLQLPRELAQSGLQIQDLRASPDGRLFALASSARRDLSRPVDPLVSLPEAEQVHLLVEQEGQLTLLAQVQHLRRLLFFEGGALALVLREVIRIQEGPQVRELPLPEAGPTWGSAPDDLYVLGKESLYWFGGRRWTALPLGRKHGFHEGHGVAGLSVLVGGDVSHSTMMMGERDDWSPTGCGAFSLGSVRVFARDHAVASGDGCWEYRGRGWHLLTGRKLVGPDKSLPGPISLMESSRGHTLLGGLEQGGELALWLRRGRLFEHRFMLEGVRVDLQPPPEIKSSMLMAAYWPWHVVARWVDGRIGLLSPQGAWLSEPVRELEAQADHTRSLARAAEAIVSIPAVRAPCSLHGAHDMGAFLMDACPVTNLDYFAFLRATGHAPPSHYPQGEPPPGLENHTVVGISREEAQAYARWRGSRLPTEEEWERAARVRRWDHRSALMEMFSLGRPEQQSTGPQDKWRSWESVELDAPFEPKEEAELAARLKKRELVLLRRTPPVVTAPGSSGLKGLGLVWEWTSSQDEQGRPVVRGGPWRDRTEAPLLTNRSWEEGPALDVGFRCARDVPAAAES